jgi:hypothetical protein
MVNIMAAAVKSECIDTCRLDRTLNLAGQSEGHNIIPLIMHSGNFPNEHHVRGPSRFTCIDSIHKDAQKSCQTPLDHPSKRKIGCNNSSRHPLYHVGTIGVSHNQNYFKSFRALNVIDNQHVHH